MEVGSRDAQDDADDIVPSRVESELPLVIVEDKMVGDFSASRSVAVTPRRKGANAMVGFEDDMMAIKGRLCGESTKLQIIPIVGMGGMGKTTLARNIYDDPLIMEYFYICAWVTVSQDSSVEETISGLLSSMEISNPSKQGNELRVYKALKGRRYLIVIDDMWSTGVWDDLKRLFPDDENGSRIMLTTRLVDVAAYADSSSSPHKMRFMDAHVSWNLLQQVVFTHDQCPPELVDIGMAIARACGGLPLAITVTAGLVSTTSMTPASWREIAQNVNSAVAAKVGQYEKILSLSYTNLPHHLRSCFLYMGGFREDKEIYVSKLIKLWIAEGFLERANGSKSLEEEAEEYLEDLVKRCLVLVTQRKCNGKIKSCNLHDLMRDLCIRKAWEDDFRLYDKGMDDFFTGCLECNRLNKVLDIGRDFMSPWYAGPELYIWIPERLFQLSALRYVFLAYFMEIPSAISNLVNLQTLIIPTKEDVVILPLEIWRMPQLRHLVSPLFGPLPCPEGSTSFALDNLQTLSQGKLDPVFPISLKKLTLIGCGILWKDMTVVGSLPNLQVLKLRGFRCLGKKWETSPGEFLKLEYMKIEGSYLQDWITESDHFPSLKCLLLRYCWYLNEIPDAIAEIPTLELIEVNVNKSLMDSAIQIQEEQRSLGNEVLQVRIGW